MNSQNLEPLVYLIVLNWNGYPDTHECLLSLRQLAYPRYKVLVVDNASSDDSPERLRAEHPEIELVVCERNAGIAAGYNRGIEAALERGAEYLVVMNNDLVFDPAFLAQMIAAQRAWPDCGIVMPKVLLYAERDVIWAAGGHPRFMRSNIVMTGMGRRDGPRYAQTRPIRYAPSCCLLLTRELCEQIAFDEQYFFYYDDWDFCVQARNVGKRIVFAADARIWHKVSRSTLNSTLSLRWWQVLGQSCVRYHRKHHSMALLAWYVTWVVARETVKGNLRSMPTFLRGIRAGLGARTVADASPRWSAS
jgi:GT2 family glycosyltransferase